MWKGKSCLGVLSGKHKSNSFHVPGLFQCHTSLCQTVKPVPHLSQTTHPDPQSSLAGWPCQPVPWNVGRCSSHCCHMNRDSLCCLSTLGAHCYPWMGQTLTAPEHSQHPTIQDWFFLPGPEENRTVRLGRHLRVLLQVARTPDPLLQQCQHTNFINFSHSCGQPGNLEAAPNDSRVTGRNLSRAGISDKATEHPEHTAPTPANSDSDVLKGQCRHPQFYFHGELLTFATLETLEHISSTWGSTELLNYKHMYLKEDKNLYFSL